MAQVLTVADYVVIGIALCISAGIGLFFRFTGGRQKTTEEFLKAGKNMSILPVACSMTATIFSAVSVLGDTTEVYLYGLLMSTMYIGLSTGGVIAAYTLVPVFFEEDISTAYQYLERRFGRITRYVASGLFCIQMILYTPMVIYAPSLALSTITGLSLWTSVLSMAAVCIFYSSLGGLKAVIWTDLFQTVLMFTSLLLVIIKGSVDLGGIGKVFEIAKDGGRLIMLNTSFNFTDRQTLWNCILNGCTLGTYISGACHIQVQRILSVKNLKRAQRASLLCWPMSTLFKALCLLAGIVVYAYFKDCDPLQEKDSFVTSSDQLFPHLVLKSFSNLPGLSGLCIAGIFSAALSTMSSSVTALVDATLEDFIKPLTKGRNLEDTKAAFLAKILAFVYGGLSVILIYLIAQHKTVLEVSLMMYGLVGGPTLGIYLLGIYTSSTNEMGALIGLLSGFSLNAWMTFGSLYNKPKYPTLPLSLDGCASSNRTLRVAMNLLDDPILNFGINNATNALPTFNKEERYVFPLYRVSFLWYTFLSCFTVVLIGYLSSKIIGIWMKRQPVNPKTISPTVRKWICGESKLENKMQNVNSSINKVELNIRSHDMQNEDA